ncbi:hypothetical protein SESBI_23005 [Sesbania bispinosa]|nr:hypothetical protein SESBI_23005 [Sesbania bispinosa]
MLQDVDEEADKDSIVNVAFKSVVGERSGYSRGLGAGIKPTKGKSAIRLQQELANEREKRQNIEMKLKEVEAQLQEERNIRQEMAARFEESQRQFEERMDKQLEERLAAVFARMQTSFLVGQSSSAMNMASDSDHRVETTNTLIARNT